MPENLSPETAEKIRALCRKISVAHNIDEEIQQELYSHMEDKFLGYLRGEEKLTEEDAFILVREHFGKPEHIRAMLEEVHVTEISISFIRKIGVVWAATLVTGIFMAIYNLTLTLLLHIPSHGESLTRPAEPSSVLFLSLYVFGALLLGSILVFWRKRMKQGKALWFQKARPLSFITLLLALFLIDTAISFVNVNDWLRLHQQSLSAIQVQSIKTGGKPMDIAYKELKAVPAPEILMDLRKFLLPYQEFWAWSALVFLIFSCGIWLWWCDVSSRRFLFLLFTVAAWVFSNSVLLLQPIHMLAFDESTGQLISHAAWPFITESTINNLVDYSALGASALGIYALLKAVASTQVKLPVSLSE